jgi:hypothetical protein
MAARTPIQRFEEKYIIDKPTGCWLWQASHAKNNYGKFGLNYKSEYAHRVSYMLYVGDIPEGLVIDHLCNNRRCVNPDHLQATTQKENASGARRKNGLGACEHGNSQSTCEEGCAKEYRRKNHYKRRDKNNAYSKKRYWENVEAERERSLEKYWADPEKARQASRDRYHKNKTSSVDKSSAKNKS